MSANELLRTLDAFGLAAAGWIATWFVHSVVLCTLALAIGRVLRADSLRVTLYKVALVGALVTTGAQALGVGAGDSLRYELSASSGSGRQIGIAGGGRAPALRLREPRASEPTLASPKALAPAAPTARWRWAHLAPLAALLAALVGARSLVRERRRLRCALGGRRVIERKDWIEDLHDLTRRAGLSRAPRLSSSAALGSPIALARGELVVPERALDGLDRDARRALLAHELAHLARRDPLWLVATALVERLLALQPLQRLVRRRLVDEIELACDAQAVRWTGCGLPLARCLATVASWIAPEPAPALVASMAARDSALVRRVERALAPATEPTTRARRRVFSVFIASALALLACSGPKVEPASEAPPARERSGLSSEDQVMRERLRALGYVAAEEDDALPTLDVATDGTIRAGDAVVYDPAGDTFERLDAHLASLVEGMERQPLDPRYPDGFQLAMGELVLHAGDGAPMRSLQKAMEHCGRIGIWRLRFTGDWPGGETGIEVPLPFDVDEIEVPLEEGSIEASLESDERAGASRRVEVTLRVVEEGRKVDVVTGDPWGGEGRFAYDDSRVVEYQVGGGMKTSSLTELAALLRSIHAQGPDRGLTVDARKGTVYRDVVDLLDAVNSAGFERVTFVGAYE